MNESIFGLRGLARPGTFPPSPRPVVADPPTCPVRPAHRSARGTAPQPTRASAPSWSASADTALIAILESPVRADETVAAGFARKESELRHVFAMLNPVEARALRLRLSIPRSNDELATAFTRLTADRRERLINFLADAHRRAALSSKTEAL